MFRKTPKLQLYASIFLGMPQAIGYTRSYDNFPFEYHAVPI